MHKLDGSRVLVTGACGFLGSHIIRRLLDLGADVVGIDLPDVLNKGSGKHLESKAEYVGADITDYQQLERIQADYDYVLHLAAIAAPTLCDQHPGKAFLTNVQGTFNVLKYAIQSRASKFVFSSTAHVYGISPKYMPTDEKHPLALQDIYTTTKIIGESLCQLYYSNHNLQYITIRLFNSYGPRQSLDYFIPAMIKQAKGGEIKLKGRSITKDFVYVDDVVDACCSAFRTSYTGEINIGSGKQTTLEYVARYIADSFDCELTFLSQETGGPTHMQSDIARAKAILDWSPATPIDRGLDQTIDFFKDVTM